MKEFNNRMVIQRNVLDIINSDKTYKEELCGLSKKAIDRWIGDNYISKEDNICKMLYKISEKLFFLATKSQDPISENYLMTTSEIKKLQDEIENIIKNNKSNKKHLTNA